MYLANVLLTLQDLINLNSANLILIPLLSITALMVNLPIVGPLFAKGCAFVFAH